MVAAMRSVTQARRRTGSSKKGGKGDMSIADTIKLLKSRGFEVTADGELLTCEPAEELPLAQKYFLF